MKVWEEGGLPHSLCLSGVLLACTCNPIQNQAQIPVRCLLGADVSILSRETYHQISKRDRPPLAPMTTTVDNAAGHALQV